MRELDLYPDVNDFFREKKTTFVSTNTKGIKIYGVEREPDFLGISVEESEGAKSTRVYMGEVKNTLIDLLKAGKDQALVYDEFADYVFLALPESEWSSAKISDKERDDFIQKCSNHNFGLLVINPTDWIIEPPLNPPENLDNKLQAALNIFVKEFNSQVLSKYETRDNKVKKNAQPLLLQALSELGGHALFYDLINLLGGEGHEKPYSNVIREVTSLNLSKQGLRTQGNQLLHLGWVTIKRDKKDRGNDVFDITEQGSKICVSKFMTYLFDEFERSKA